MPYYTVAYAGNGATDRITGFMNYTATMNGTHKFEIDVSSPRSNAQITVSNSILEIHRVS
jgi:hypothetical protein